MQSRLWRIFSLERLDPFCRIFLWFLNRWRGSCKFLFCFVLSILLLIECSLTNLSLCSPNPDSLRNGNLRLQLVARNISLLVLWLSDYNFLILCNKKRSLLHQKYRYFLSVFLLVQFSLGRMDAGRWSGILGVIFYIRAVPETFLFFQFRNRCLYTKYVCDLLKVRWLESELCCVAWRNSEEP